MSTKERVLETIRELPENATWREIEDRIHFLAAIDKARDEVRNGEVVPHEEVRNLLGQWTST
jgi:predicted transcriptional regulator